MSGPIEKIDGRPKNNSFSFRAAGVHNEAHIESTRGTAMEVTTHRGQGPLQQVIEIGPHRLLTDVGPESGGEASGPARPAGGGAGGLHHAHRQPVRETQGLAAR
jgi:hypothetical protein